MNSELKKTVIIGSGNLAEALARAVAKSELELVQIFARNAERARVVAELAATGWETRPEMLRKDADIYLIAVSDRAVAEVAATLPKAGALNGGVPTPNKVSEEEILKAYQTGNLDALPDDVRKYFDEL